jgi:hypothetical protein
MAVGSLERAERIDLLIHTKILWLSRLRLVPKQETEWIRSRSKWKASTISFALLRSWFTNLPHKISQNPVVGYSFFYLLNNHTPTATMTAEPSSPKEKKGLFGKKVKDAPESPKSPGKEKKLERQGSASSHGSAGKSFWGAEKKKPRAEYQAEIDELKLKLAQANLDLDNVSSKYQALKGWAKSAPL